MKLSISGKLFTVGLITFWYASNIGVLLLNKFLLSNYGFRYPIFLTLCHMMACSIFSYIAISWLKVVPMQTVSSRVQFVKISSLGLIFCLSVVGGNISLRYLPVSFNQAVGATTPFFTAVFAYLMTLKTVSQPMQTVSSRVQFVKISSLGLIFCLSVVGGNISLRYLPVSFNQAVGATTPFFTAVFAYLMTLKREAWLTYITLIPVVTGVMIASGGEPSFHLFGFMMCISATAARALKTVLQGILLSSEGEKLNSMNLLMYMAPVAVAFLLPVSIIMEEDVLGITFALVRDDSKMMWLLIFNSALAYFVNLTNFLVTKHTSALTLQVLGNAKGAVAVVISILIFQNPVSVTGMMGYSLTVIGVILYSEAKKRSKRDT